MDANSDVWSNGAWFILKPRFFHRIKTKKTELNAVITSLLELDDTVNISDKMVHQALIDNTDNDTLFDVFIMLKIALEKMGTVSPQRVPILSPIN